MNVQPNIVFVLSDQHNAKCLGHAGHADVRTPQLDRLAREGVRFERAVAQNVICTPSRVSFLSGQYCHNHGYYGLSGPKPLGLPTILGHFRRHGYRTAAIGKIHCPAYWVEDDCDLFLESGFGSIGGNPEFEAYLDEKGLRETYGKEVHAKHPCGRGQLLDGFPSELAAEDHPEHWSASRLCDFIKGCARDHRPFFAHLSFAKPHQVYGPAREFWDLYDEDELTLPPNTDGSGEGKAPPLIRQAALHRKAEWTMFEPRTFEAGRRRKLHGYLGNISQVDQALGTVLECLDDLNLTDNTIVVYSADHGDYACEHGIMEKAPGICSDAITRVPSIWRWPGRVAAGHVSSKIVESVDLSATLCSLAGLDPLETSDGQDLSALLSGADKDIHTIGVTEHPWSRSVYKGHYRLVYYPRNMFLEAYPDGFGELYNLEDDPWELRNLYFDAEHQSVVRDMERELADWLVQTSRPATIIYGAGEGSPQRTFRYGHYTNSDGKIHYKHVADHRDENYT